MVETRLRIRGCIQLSQHCACVEEERRGREDEEGRLWKSLARESRWSGFPCGQIRAIPPGCGSNPPESAALAHPRRSLKSSISPHHLLESPAAVMVLLVTLCNSRGYPAPGRPCSQRSFFKGQRWESLIALSGLAEADCNVQSVWCRHLQFAELEPSRTTNIAQGKA